MIWLAIVLLAVAALAPLAIALERKIPTTGARALAVDLHRSQLAELDRDLAEGRILPPEHATATVEVQRRLLAAADQADAAPRQGRRTPIVAALVLTPAAAAALYLVSGQPDIPSVTPGSQTARMQRALEESALIDQLRDRLKSMDPNTDQARQGYVLLGNVEEARGNDAAAVTAWRTALSGRFDATLAIRIAAASERIEGGLSPSTAALLRRALAAAPSDAPWRQAVQDRLNQSGL